MTPSRRMRKSEAIAPSDKRVVQTLLWALKPLSNLRRSIPLPYAVTFLTVALEEGKPVGAYARELDFNRYVMSRYMQCIVDKARNGGAGLGLVTVKRTTRVIQPEPTFFLQKRGGPLPLKYLRTCGALVAVSDQPHFRISGKPQP
jgi:hypothetical protein